MALANLEEKNDPIPAPQADKLFAAAEAAVVAAAAVPFASVVVVDGLLACSCAPGLITPFADEAEDENDDKIEKGLDADFGDSAPFCP